MASVPPGRVESIHSRLNLAVWLVDGVTGRGGRVDAVVAVVPPVRKAVRNLSGHYCFSDMDPGTYRVEVRPTGSQADHYLPTSREVDVRALDPRSPELIIELSPSAAYPFPSAATLVRGSVLYRGQPYVGAELALVGHPAVRGSSGGGGEFALALPPAIGAQLVHVEVRSLVAPTRTFTVLIRPDTETHAGPIDLG